MVDMLGVDRAAEAGEIGIAHVVDEDTDDVGFLLGGMGLAQRRRGAEDKSEN